MYVAGELLCMSRRSCYVHCEATSHTQERKAQSRLDREMLQFPKHRLRDVTVTITKIEGCASRCDHTQARHHIEVSKRAAQREAQTNAADHLKGVTVVLLLCYCGVTVLLLLCYCGVTVLLLLCYCGVTVVLLLCYCGVTVLLLCCYCGVTVVFLWCYCGVTVVLLWREQRIERRRLMQPTT
jgi:hypothetical protein